MIFTNLKKHSEYKEEIIKEIEKAFHYTEENLFRIDFYHLIKETNHHNCHILINENNEFMAHIGVRPTTLNYKGSKLKIILLGGIVTKEKYQGQGCFKALYNHIVKLYEKEYGLIVLWSDQNLFYEKLGFRQFGLTSVLGTTPATEKEIIQRGYQQVQIEDLTKDQLEILNNKYTNSYKDTISIERNIVDWQDIKKITSMKLFFNKNQEHYLFFEKGEDLKGIIHEISFTNNKEELKKFKPLQLLTPFNLDKESFLIHLAWGKVINLPLFSKFINSISGQRIHIQSENILMVNDTAFEIIKEELLPILFGPNTAKEVYSLIPPIYITGADSI